MADVNWKEYDCRICLSVTLLAAAAASSVITMILGSLGLGIVPLVVLFLIVWAVLGWLSDGFCTGRAGAAQTQTHASNADLKPHGTETDVVEPSAASEVDETKGATVEKPAADAKALADEQAVDKPRASENEAADQKAAIAASAAAAVEAKGEAVASNRTTKDPEADATATDFSSDIDLDRDGDGIAEGSDEGTRPQALDGPRDGTADDLKRIKGIGPKLQQLCNTLGFYHFDQIAGWSSDEVAWVDSNLEGFKGRVSRDEWVEQAKLLAKGDETEFSKRVDGGDVPSSQ